MQPAGCFTEKFTMKLRGKISYKALNTVLKCN